MNNKPVFCLMGPTASGKTALATMIYQRFPVEIISVDSVMIYRGMDIGTAKPTQLELQETPHHLIDILDPIESYSLKEWYDDVHRLCHAIHARGKVPLLVGGTMMYFNALQKGLSCLPQASYDIRTQLSTWQTEFGLPYLFERLKKADPVSASRIHPHDTQRICRALEVYMLTGKPMHEHWVDKELFGRSTVNFILMPAERQWLHTRIAHRFTGMLQQGLVDEVRKLREHWSLDLSYSSMRTVGYRQVYEHLLGIYGEQELLARGIAATRQLAKRQMTWLRQWEHAHWFECADNDTYIANKIINILKEACDA